MSYNLLKGKRGIIFGALNDMSIAWKVAERCAEEGASIVLSNTEMALRMGELDALAKKINAPVVAADATAAFADVKWEADLIIHGPSRRHQQKLAQALVRRIDRHRSGSRQI